MRNTTPLLLLILLFLLNLLRLKGQESTAGFDTIYHQVDTLSFDMFHFDHPDFKDVSFKRFPMVLLKPLTVSKAEQEFSIGGLIVNDIDILNWEVVLFGKWRNKRRVLFEWDTEEGLNFFSQTENKIYWGNPFTGSVLSGTDTISNFSVYTKPAKQAIFSSTWQTAKSFKDHSNPSIFKEALSSFKNFGITGSIDSIPFKIIYIEPVRMAWIFKEEQLKAVFATADFYSAKISLTDGRPSPKTFLLIKPGHRWDDEAEMIRLSILTMFIADAVRPENLN